MFRSGYASERRKEAIVIEGDIAEEMRLEKKKETDLLEKQRVKRKEKKREYHQYHLLLLLQKYQTPKKSVKKNQNDATIASISEQLEKQSNTIDKIGAIFPPYKSILNLYRSNQN
jgi:hypothetical protein